MAANAARLSASQAAGIRPPAIACSRAMRSCTGGRVVNSRPMPPPKACNGSRNVRLAFPGFSSETFDRCRNGAALNDFTASLTSMPWSTARFM
jgi:hypothetical protein